MLGRPLSEILVPEPDRPRILEHISTYLATGSPEEFTGQLRVPTRHADGAGEPGAAIEAVRGFGYRYVPPA